MKNVTSNFTCHRQLKTTMTSTERTWEGTWNRIKRNKETIWCASCGYPTWFCTKWRAGEKIRTTYGFDVCKQTTEKTDDIDKSLESIDGPVITIVAHCGVNDIWAKDPKDVSKTMVKSLKGILKARPNLKVIVSKIPPVKTQTYKQRDSFSTHLFFSELVEDPNISFVAHEILHFTEGHHSSQYEGVVYPREESWQTYS